ncbi:MAG TPA: metal ABC transporter permease [Candidatus Dormibacteraeota bacterium]|nr:metal ABC transporter permease [Candidatus Dormibacteraeota bacterium]
MSASLGAHLLVAQAGAGAFSWNLVSDIGQMLSFEFMRNAFEAGAMVSIVAGVVGYFVILRRTAFAAHALSHVGFAGAAGAAVISISPVWGLLVFCLGGAGVMGALGQRIRERDTVIGIVLAFMLGLGVLFISLYSGYATEAYSILFGEVLGISTGDVALTAVIGAVTLLLLAAMYRPLLFSSVDEEVAEARGVPTRLLAIGFMATLALAVAVAVQVVGVLLIFSLLVTPAAIADRLTSRPATAMLVSVVTALACTVVGLAIAFYVPIPVSVFITTLAFATYLVVRWAPRVVRSNPPTTEGAP